MKNRANKKAVIIYKFNKRKETVTASRLQQLLAIPSLKNQIYTYRYIG